MHRHIIMVKIIDLAAKTEQMFCTDSVTADAAGPLFRGIVTTLLERHRMKRDDRYAPHFVYFARLVFPDGGDKAIEVSMAPETVCAPTVDKIVAEVARLSPFTFGPR